MTCNGQHETIEPLWRLLHVACCWALAFARGICPSWFVKAVCDSSVPEDLSEHCFCESHRKHEWDKHGTCAAQVDALNSEKKYFGKSLDLYKQIDLNRWAHTSLQATGNECRESTLANSLKCMVPERSVLASLLERSRAPDNSDHSGL